ncbi:MAG: PadR family transcriptional regulator [Bacilli bacterium]|jgi:PadR family transcriptional regulator PadR|nr:PadR family transcriptional regulator [Bacilli bacterium]MDD4057166.1 PadR family transcriptional regulator [Bacilli bacterium]
MDIQLKRGLLEVCVLSVLQQEDSYGYKIVKDVSGIIEISESTLYPILKRLEINNSLKVYEVSHNGRLRKYYSITNAGKKAINDFIGEWQDVMKVYNFIKGDQ